MALYPFGNAQLLGLFAMVMRDSFALNSTGFITVNPRLVQSTPGEMN